MSYGPPDRGYQHCGNGCGCHTNINQDPETSGSFPLEDEDAQEA